METKEQQTNPLLIIGIVVVGYLVLSGQIDLSKILDNLRPKPAPTPVVVPVNGPRQQPTNAALLAPAQALRAKLTSAPVKAAMLEGHYAGMAEVLRGDSSGAIASVQAFRSGHSKGLDIINRRTGLESVMVGTEIDAVLAAAIGTTPGPMDSAKREQAAQACDAIAWACYAARQGGG